MRVRVWGDGAGDGLAPVEPGVEAAPAGEPLQARAHAEDANAAG